MYQQELFTLSEDQKHDVDSRNYISEVSLGTTTSEIILVMLMLTVMFP